MLAACTDDFHAAEGGWTEATLTKPAAVSHVEYYPREGFLSRSAGGRFVGVVKGSLRVVTLATIPSTPQLQSNGLGVAEVRGGGESFPRGGRCLPVKGGGRPSFGDSERGAWAASHA